MLRSVFWQKKQHCWYRWTFVFFCIELNSALNLCESVLRWFHNPVWNHVFLLRYTCNINPLSYSLATVSFFYDAQPNQRP